MIYESLTIHYIVINVYRWKEEQIEVRLTILYRFILKLPRIIIQLQKLQHIFDR